MASGIYQGALLPLSLYAWNNAPTSFTTNSSDNTCTFINQFELRPSDQLNDAPYVQDNLIGDNSLVVAYNQIEWLNGSIIQPFTTNIDLDASTGRMTVTMTTVSAPKNQQSSSSYNTYTFIFDNVNTNKTSNELDVTFLRWNDDYATNPVCTPESFTGKVTLQLPQDFAIFVKKDIPDTNSFTFCPKTIELSKGSNAYTATSSTIFVQINQDSIKDSSFRPFLTSTNSTNGTFSDRTVDDVSGFYQANVGFTPATGTCNNVSAQLQKNINGNTIGVIELELKATNNTFAATQISVIGGSFPTKELINNNFNEVKYGDIIQIYQSGDSSKILRYLCYRDRNKFNTPYMTCETFLGEPCDDACTYWTIYKWLTPRDKCPDGCADLGFTGTISTTDIVAFRSLQCPENDSCFGCSFMSCQKQGGRAPSMEGKSVALACESWRIIGATTDKMLYEKTQFRLRSTSNRGCTNPDQDLTSPCLVVLQQQDLCLDGNKGANPSSKLWSFKKVNVTPEIALRKCT